MIWAVLWLCFSVYVQWFFLPGISKIVGISGRAKTPAGSGTHAWTSSGVPLLDVAICTVADGPFGLTLALAGAAGRVVKVNVIVTVFWLLLTAALAWQVPFDSGSCTYCVPLTSWEGGVYWHHLKSDPIYYQVAFIKSIVLRACS